MLKDNPAFYYWFYLAIYFFFKMFSNSLIQGIARFKGNSFKYPEDKETFGGGREESSRYQDLDMRATNCWRNDLENIPMFLILALGFVLMGAKAQTCLIYFSVYAFTRTVHSFCLYKGKQPLRGIFFQAGNLATITMIIHSFFLAA